MKNISLVLAVLSCLFACNSPQTAKQQKPANDSVAVAKDVHTLSNADQVEMKHLDLDIEVDMQNKQIRGCALWTIQNKSKVKTLTLDTYDLTIDKVFVDGNEVKFVLDSLIRFFGSALHIPIKDNSATVMVCYKTGKSARALQWLDPQQTHDKQKPFLFTQSESIYARSWIPCADGRGYPLHLQC